MKTVCSSIETLEARISPAALAVTFAGGALKLFGDPVNAGVTVVQMGSSTEVKDGTTSLGIFTGVKSLDAKIDGGATLTLSFAGDGLTGATKVISTGATTLVIGSSSKLQGGLTFSGDAAARTLTVGGVVVIGKGLTFKGGAGADSFTWAEGGSIDGNFTLSSVESGAFNADNISTEITGNLVVKNAGNALAVSISTPGAAGLSIGGAVSYAGGKLNDRLELSGTVAKGVTFTDLLGGNKLSLDDGIVIHGSLAMTGGEGDDTLTMNGGTVDGDVKLKLGNGTNLFTYGFSSAVHIGGGLSFTGGSGKDTWQTESEGMTVGKDVSLLLGNGNNAVAALCTTQGKKLTVTTGSGKDSIAIDGLAANAAAIIKLGAGADTLAGALLQSVKTASIDGGADVDHLQVQTFVADPIVIVAFENFT